MCRLKALERGVHYSPPLFWNVLQTPSNSSVPSRCLNIWFGKSVPSQPWSSGVILSWSRHNSGVNLPLWVVSAAPHPILMVNKSKVKRRTRWLLRQAGGMCPLLPEAGQLLVRREPIAVKGPRRQSLAQLCTWAWGWWGLSRRILDLRNTSL